MLRTFWPRCWLILDPRAHVSPRQQVSKTNREARHAQKRRARKSYSHAYNFCVQPLSNLVPSAIRASRPPTNGPGTVWICDVKMSKIFGHFARAEKWMTSRDRGFQNRGSFFFASTRIYCKRCRFICCFQNRTGTCFGSHQYLGKDFLTKLPIGSGKSLIFQLILVKAITFVWLCAGGVPCKLVLHFFLY